MHEYHEIGEDGFRQHRYERDDIYFTKHFPDMQYASTLFDMKVTVLDYDGVNPESLEYRVQGIYRNSDGITDGINDWTYDDWEFEEMELYREVPSNHPLYHRNAENRTVMGVRVEAVFGPMFGNSIAIFTVVPNVTMYENNLRFYLSFYLYDIVDSYGNQYNFDNVDTEMYQKMNHIADWMVLLDWGIAQFRDKKEANESYWETRIEWFHYDDCYLEDRCVGRMCVDLIESNMNEYWY